MHESDLDERRPSAHGMLPAAHGRPSPMDLLQQHGQAMEEFDRRVRAVPDDRWHDPTPCEEWDVRDLVNHLVSEQLWAPHLLAGETLEEVGDRYEGDVLGDDPVATWERASRQAREAFLRPGALDGTVHTSMGELPASEYTQQMTIDLAIHGWDLARAVGAEERLDRQLVQELFEVWEPRQPLLASSGVFAPPVDVPEDADVQVRLLAVLGRDGR
jgi:uncharacterized protein (TIGR03086 family)